MTIYSVKHKSTKIKNKGRRMLEQDKIVINQTKQWLEEIIVGLNFCPFAKKELVANSIHYHVSKLKQTKLALAEVIEQCRFMAEHEDIETSLIIFDLGYKSFDKYLELLDYANDLLASSGFEGTFQLASFHPEYCFEGEAYDDAANYTNRSPYPMIHIIREESLERVLNVYKNPEDIPDNNIELARAKGNEFFKQVLERIQNHVVDKEAEANNGVNAKTIESK